METTTVQKTDEQTGPKEYVLTALHRCDRCQAQAYFHVTLVNSEGADAGELYFCRHDYIKNEDALLPFIKDVIDESDRLVENRLMGNENS